MATNKASVTVIDSICGSGKTLHIFKYFKSITHKENGDRNLFQRKHFIFVTPFNKEIDRLLRENNSFVQPKGKDKDGENVAKTIDLIEILRNPGNNIAMTHSLFFISFKLILDFLDRSSLPYELVIDESPDIYKLFDLKEGDLKILISHFDFLPINETTDPDGVFKKDLPVTEIARCQIKDETKAIKRKGSKYNDLFDACIKENLYIINNRIFISIIPINLLTSFAKVTFLTYMFKGQFNELFLKAHNIDIIYKYVEKDSNNKYELHDGFKPYSGKDLKHLITIFEPKNNKKSQWYNEIGEKYTLSKTWYDEAKKKEREKVKMAMNGYFRLIGAEGKNFLWTTYEDYKEEFKMKGYKKDLPFCTCTARATNSYRTRFNCAYMINININPDIDKFTNKLSHDISFKKNIFSLSSLIQWVFRSAIRDNKPINLYIPSKRMRDLFVQWLNGEFKG